jgi:hypothetical protein
MRFEILRFSDLAPALVHAWDRLAAGRGMQADLYSSHAWLAAWVRAMGAEVADALRIPAVLGPDQPVALLPLVVRSRRRWEWAGKGGSRMRYRPVLAADLPPEHGHGGSHTNRPPIAAQRAVLGWPRQGLGSPA